MWAHRRWQRRQRRRQQRKRRQHRSLNSYEKFENKLTKRNSEHTVHESAPIHSNRLFTFSLFRPPLHLAHARSCTAEANASASIYSLKCHFPPFAKHTFLSLVFFSSVFQLLAECALTTMVWHISHKTVWFEDGPCMARVGKRVHIRQPVESWEKATPNAMRSQFTIFVVTFFDEQIFKWACVRSPVECGAQIFGNIMRHHHRMLPSLSHQIHFSAFDDYISAAKMFDSLFFKVRRVLKMHWRTLHSRRFTVAVFNVRFGKTEKLMIGIVRTPCARLNRVM